MNYLRFYPRAATLLCSEFRPETYSGCSFSTSLSFLHHHFSSLNWILSICCYFSRLKKKKSFFDPIHLFQLLPQRVFSPCFLHFPSLVSPIRLVQTPLDSSPWPRPAVTSVLLHVVGPSWSSRWYQQLQQHWPSWSYPFSWGSSFGWLPGNVFLVSHLS